MINCNLTVNYYPCSPKESIEAFYLSAQKTSTFKNYKKHLNQLETELKTQISQNKGSANIDVSPDNFYLECESGKIYLKNNTKNNFASKYEYGYGNHAPYSYIRPSAYELGNKISDLIVEDAIDEYNNLIAGKRLSHAITPNIQSKYMNKYNF